MSTRRPDIRRLLRIEIRADRSTAIVRLELGEYAPARVNRTSSAFTRWTPAPSRFRTHGSPLPDPRQIHRPSPAAPIPSCPRRNSIELEIDPAPVDVPREEFEAAAARACCDWLLPELGGESGRARTSAGGEAAVILAPGRPTSRGVTWWMYSRSGTPGQPIIDGPDGRVDPSCLVRIQDVKGRYIAVAALDGARPDSAYTLRVADPERTQHSCSTRTLPVALRLDVPFNIQLGTCYSAYEDRGKLRASPEPAEIRADSNPVHMRFLLGDQIYADFDPDTGSPYLFRTSIPDVRRQYERQWESDHFAGFWRRSPTLTMADDHELWNDYPHYNVWLPFARTGSQLEEAARTALAIFQFALNIDARTWLTAPNPVTPDWILQHGRTLELVDSPVPIFLLDTRTERTRFDREEPLGGPHFTQPDWLQSARDWLRGLPAPGLLFVSQPMVEKRNGWFSRTLHTMGDNNLPDYEDDFAALWESVFEAPHDVLIVSGDIHWSRLYRVSRPDRAQRSVYELIASPLARIAQDKGSRDVDDASGTFATRDGRPKAAWQRIYARNGTSTYTLLSLQGGTQLSGSALRARASLWSCDAQAPVLPYRLAEGSFDLN